MLGVLAGISAGTNILGGLIQGISGAKRARRARREIQNYQRQDLQNAFRGVSVSTMGADLQREEANRALATTVNAAQRMGTRGLGMATNAMCRIECRWFTGERGDQFGPSLRQIEAAL